MTSKLKLLFIQGVCYKFDPFLAFCVGVISNFRRQYRYAAVLPDANRDGAHMKQN